MLVVLRWLILVSGDSGFTLYVGGGILDMLGWSLQLWVCMGSLRGAVG